MLNQSRLNAFLNYLNKKSPVFALTLSTSAGNAAEEYYFAQLYARRENKKLLVLRLFTLFGFPKYGNTAFCDLKSPYTFNFFPKFFQFWGNLFLTIAFGHIPVTVRYLWYNFKRLFNGGPYKTRWLFFDQPTIGSEMISNPWGLKEFSWEKVNSIEWGREFNTPLGVQIPERFERECERRMRKMGLTADAWYVCLHIREGGLHGDHWSPRNSTVSNYVEAIRAITSLGGWVVRLGDSTMTKLPPMERVIDYPFLPLRSEMLDFYLVKNCRLYFGQGSGPVDFATLFNKKTVLVNLAECAYTPHPRKGCLAILRHVYSKKEKRYFSVKDFLEAPQQAQHISPLSPDYIYVENTPEEIRDVVLEALGEGPDPVRTPLQNEFIRKRRESIHRWFEEHEWMWDSKNHFDKKTFDDAERHLRFRMANRADQSLGTLGKKFIELNWEKSQMTKAPF